MSRIRESLGSIRAQSLVVALVVLFSCVSIAALVGNGVYITQKNALQLQGQLNAKESAREHDRCLLTRANIVTVAGYAVDEMISEGKKNAAIVEYLTNETNYIIATLDPSTTGLYGWINGAYLDGAGWVPDADYVATERPWYTQTLESDQKVTFVEPYLDMQTKTVMMTISTLLSDGESVVAMDVSLDPLQQIVEQVATSTAESQALVLDLSGIVVAHSDAAQLGKNYRDEPDSLGGMLARKILDEGMMQFDIDTDEGNYSVYVDELEGGWYSVSLINANLWYRPLKRVVIAFYVILALVVAFLLSVFLNLNRKNQSLQKLLTQVDQEHRRGQEFQMLSETDRMTGLYDRVNGQRKIEELLDANVGGMFLVLDIDNFKSFNDTFGHKVGDLVILAVADSLHSTFRSNDITMRLGGDEFGAFAVGIDSQELGTTIIRRVFNRLDSLEMPELRGEKFSISVGATLCAGSNLTFDRLYASADAAMYASKKSSGNSLTFGTL